MNKHFVLTFVIAMSGLLSFAQKALAQNFSGQWKGNGTIIRRGSFGAPSDEGPCSSIEISIRHEGSKLNVLNYRGKCGLVDSEWGPYELEIQGEDVYREGERIGSLRDGVLLTSSASGGVQYAFNLRIQQAENGELELESYYGTRSLVGAIVIEGRLRKRQNMP